MTETYIWNKDIFQVLTMSEACQKLNSGIFIFAEIKSTVFQFSFRALYVGQTDNFQSLITHPKWSLAEKNGAAYVHILAIRETDRNSKIEQIIKIYNPPLNLIKDVIQPTSIETPMTNETNISEQFSETKSKLELLYQYEKHYLGLIKEYKEEIKFANTLQEDLRRERTQFFTQTLKDVMQTMKSAEVDKSVSSQWIQELVSSYTKSIDLSGDLAKTHVIEILSLLTGEAKKEASNAQIDNITPQVVVK